MTDLASLHPCIIAERVRLDDFNEDEVLVGELRHHLARGDLLAVIELLEDLDHVDLAETFYDRIGVEQTFWPRRSGWCTHVFARRVCLAFYEPEGNGLYSECRTCALPFEKGHEVLVALGLQGSPLMWDLVGRMTPDELARAGAIRTLEHLPDRTGCRDLKLVSGEVVRMEGVLLRYVGLEPGGAPTFVGMERDFIDAHKAWKRRVRWAS